MCEQMTLKGIIHCTTGWIWITIAIISLGGMIDALPSPKVAGGLANNLNTKGKLNVSDKRLSNKLENPELNLIVPALEDDVNNISDDSPPDVPPLARQLMRVPRAVIYKSNIQKHITRIPSTKPLEGHHHTSAQPPESDEDAFESLEANREAFLDILNENAKRPKRRKSSNRQSKIQLRYDPDTKRYTITEQQSEEF